MLTKWSCLITVLALSSMLIFTIGCKVPHSQGDPLVTVTLEIQQTVQTQLYNLDLDMVAAAAQLRSTGLSGPDARRILNGLYGKYPFLIDTLTADTSGKIVTVAPDAYSSYEGTDMSQEPLMIKFYEDQRATLSQMFRAVEGVNGVVIIMPVLSEHGSFAGSLSVLFRPSSLFTMTVGHRLQGTGIALNVMQLDGLNIYDSQGNDTGKNLFTDPEYQPYADLIALGQRIATTESGLGGYMFTDSDTGKPVHKLAFWSTVSLHGTAWRLVCVQ
jgi:hypothetical protein